VTKGGDHIKESGPLCRKHFQKEDENNKNCLKKILKMDFHKLAYAVLVRF